MKSKVLFFALVSFLFLSSFGLIEYSVIRPKFSVTQQDSLQRARNQNITLSNKQISTSNTPSEERKEQKDSSIEWSKYILMGMKAILGSLIKLISAL
jgi:hypothetical protein